MSLEGKLVKEFHLKFGHYINAYKALNSLCGEPNAELELTKLLFNRARFIQQESSEFTEAVAKNDICGMYDALIDLLYFIHGTAVIMGFDLLPGFIAVHESNMSKSMGKDNGGKVLKGPDWKPADIAGILRKQGFDIAMEE